MSQPDSYYYITKIYKTNDQKYFKIKGANRSMYTSSLLYSNENVNMSLLTPSPPPLLVIG